MKILVLHNSYQIAGGEDVVVSLERSLLKERGHEVRSVEVNNDRIGDAVGMFSAGVNAIYSLGARQLVGREIEEFQPDIVHVHNFFPLLSPSVYDACREYAIPIVQTLHNYRLACPNALFYRDGSPCEDCLGHLVPWPGIVHRCYRGSRVQTAAVAGMLAVHRLRGTWTREDITYIALTGFQKEKLVRAGLSADRVFIKPNFVPDSSGFGEAEGDYALFVGRLSDEKGLGVLLAAYSTYGVKVPLKVIGDGPLKAAFAKQVQESELEEVVEFLGRQEPVGVARWMRGARLLVLPSVCYEGFPITVIEAFASGLPVLASRIGGLPEVVKEGKTGWLAPPSDPSAWALALTEAFARPDEARRRGAAARASYVEYYTPDANYTELIKIYETALQRVT